MKKIAEIHRKVKLHTIFASSVSFKLNGLMDVNEYLISLNTSTTMSHFTFSMLSLPYNPRTTMGC